MNFRDKLEIPVPDQFMTVNAENLVMLVHSSYPDITDNITLISSPAEAGGRSK